MDTLLYVNRRVPAHVMRRAREALWAAAFAEMPLRSMILPLTGLQDC